MPSLAAADVDAARQPLTDRFLANEEGQQS